MRTLGPPGFEGPFEAFNVGDTIDVGQGWGQSQVVNWDG